MNALQLRDNAKQQLAEIKTIETGVEYLNKVKAIETWAKAEKKDAELQNIIAEQKLRTQRILGGLLKTDLKHNSNQYVAGNKEVPALSDFGITKNVGNPSKFNGQPPRLLKTRSQRSTELSDFKLL